MKIVVQNVLKASVNIDGKLYSKIDRGFLLLVSFTFGDTKEICDKMVSKITKLRVFEDENGKTNLSLNDISGKILSVSQFTLYADVKHGNRPSFTNCLTPQDAKTLYEYFNEKLKEEGFTVENGVFGADMKVELINDGPFTLVMDSKELF